MLGHVLILSFGHGYGSGSGLGARTCVVRLNDALLRCRDREGPRSSACQCRSCYRRWVLMKATSGPDASFFA